MGVLGRARASGKTKSLGGQSANLSRRATGFTLAGASRARHTWLEPLVGEEPRACDTLNGQRLGAKRRAWYR
eukprot:scaffold83789_cov63-Phaeocystis_antarctica.AAC.8